MSGKKTLTGDPSLINAGLSSSPANPMDLFSGWIQQAEQIPVPEARGFVLSTADKEGMPSSRTLLMKSFDETGIVFCTSALSQKGLEMKENSNVAGTFWWRETLQQINFKGTVTQLSGNRSDKLFQERVKSAQAIAVLSQQSKPLLNASDLKLRVNKLTNNESTIPRPKDWYGYHCRFTEVEFWVGSQDRFHKRLKYIFNKGVWKALQLHP